MRTLVGAASLTAAMLMSLPASAQDGAISGRVLDAAGDELPGVSVQTVILEQRQWRLAVTDLEGRYLIDGLPPGEYAIVFTLPGFRPVTRQDIDLEGNSTATVDAEMKYDDMGDDVRLTLSDPSAGGAFALECTFRPSGEIAECRQVLVPSTVLIP